MSVYPVNLQREMLNLEYLISNLIFLTCYTGYIFSFHVFRQLAQDFVQQLKWRMFLECIAIDQIVPGYQPAVVLQVGF